MEPAWGILFYYPEQVCEVSINTYYGQLGRYRLCMQNFNQIFYVNKGNNLVNIQIRVTEPDLVMFLNHPEQVSDVS